MKTHNLIGFSAHGINERIAELTLEGYPKRHILHRLIEDFELVQQSASDIITRLDGEVQFEPGGGCDCCDCCDCDSEDEVLAGIEDEVCNHEAEVISMVTNVPISVVAYTLDNYDELLEVHSNLCESAAVISDKSALRPVRIHTAKYMKSVLNELVEIEPLAPLVDVYRFTTDSNIVNVGYDTHAVISFINSLGSLLEACDNEDVPTI